MTKRSGFAVKITAFIEADPKDMNAMRNGVSAQQGLLKYLDLNRFVAVDVSSRFMLSKDIPDEPVPIAPADRVVASGDGSSQTGGLGGEMFAGNRDPIPPALDRRPK